MKAKYNDVRVIADTVFLLKEFAKTKKEANKIASSFKQKGFKYRIFYEYGEYLIFRSK